MLSKSPIDFSSTGSLSKQVYDFISGNVSLESAPIQNRRQFRNRDLLVKVLISQNQDVHQAATDNILLLSNPDTFTVTTGHQLNLFTGPLYFIYKILTAIKLAQALNEKYPDRKFVPVYWMASEDHDFEEINHTYIFGKKVEWKPTDNNKGGAAGRLKCAGIKEVIKEISSILGDSEESRNLIRLLESCYVEDSTLSQATRKLADTLFGNYGLVILDADDPLLKKTFINVMKADLTENSPFQKVNEEIEEFKKLGYEPQVHPREINIFYLSENSRERIVKEGNQYKVLNREIAWNENDLLKELESHPERFSPNVVLRPLYQEVVLPNVAYIGGPAEIAYWLQYKSMFNHFNVSFPSLYLRNCAMLVDENSRQRFGNLGFVPTDIFKTPDDLIKAYLLRNETSFQVGDEMSRIAEIFQSVIEKAAVVDPTLRASAEGERQRQLNSLKALEEKVIRAQKKKNETVVMQIQKMKEKFFPGGSLQERRENFIPYYMKHRDDFFEDLLKEFEIPVSQFLILTFGDLSKQR